MFKKCLVLLICGVCILGCWGINNKPIFSDYASEYTVYLQNSSNFSKVKKANNLQYFLTFNKSGESCFVNQEQFNALELANRFNAKLVFTEEVEQGINYYFYSKEIKYSQKLNGHKVNMQVFVASDYAVLGCPIIYGGY